MTYALFEPGDGLTVKSTDGGIASVCIVFDRPRSDWSLIIDGEKYESLKNGFLHEFVDIISVSGNLADEITVLSGTQKMQIGEICIFGEGQTPDYVQKRKPCHGRRIFCFFRLTRTTSICFLPV